MKQTKFLATVLGAGLLAGCAGYTPLYAPTEGALTNLHVRTVSMNDIEPNVGERRVAQIVAQDLRQRFRGTSSADYHLDVMIEEEESSLAIRRDATDQRLELELVAETRLYQGDKLVLDTHVESTTAYNVETSPFGTETGKRQAREEAGRELVDKIIRRAALYFNQAQKPVNTAGHR